MGHAPTCTTAWKYYILILKLVAWNRYNQKTWQVVCDRFYNIMGCFFLFNWWHSQPSKGPSAPAVTRRVLVYHPTSCPGTMVTEAVTNFIIGSPAWSCITTWTVLSFKLSPYSSWLVISKEPIFTQNSPSSFKLQKSSSFNLQIANVFKLSSTWVMLSSFFELKLLDQKTTFGGKQNYESPSQPFEK